MSDNAPAPPRRRNGKIWRQMPAGEPVGRPIAEWAYVTPRFPAGITRSALAVADEATQQEVALFWFWSNLKPFDLTGGGPYFGYNGDANAVGYGQGTYAPSHTDAKIALHTEFGHVLEESLLNKLGQSLGREWMWSIESTAVQTEADFTTIRQALAGRLDDIAALIRTLRPEHGAPGHNQPDSYPLTINEADEALQALDETKAALLSDDGDTSDRVRHAWKRFKPFVERLGNWLIKQADAFVSGIAEEGGKSIGKALPLIVAAAAAAVSHSSHLDALLEALIKRAG